MIWRLMAITCALAAFGPLLATRAEEPATVQPQVDYVRDVKPVLESRCYACHGSLKQQQGLRLDTAAMIRQGGDSGPAAVAHQSGQSPLFRAVTGADGWRMPPEGEPLTAGQIEKLKGWIDAGAVGPADEAPAKNPATHWSFKRPESPPIPTVTNAAWVRNPIDAFIAESHQTHHLQPRPAAEKSVLLRRVYLDLTGLPPTADELRSYLSDESPDAYDRVVDRLLASPAYGERWARHWMDIWRYSDWYGWAAEVRNSQQHIWHWRDWIVESLNADRGYDRMVVEMLAGDEVAPTDPTTLRATGYLARNWYRFNRNTWLQDTVEHTAKAFVGLTFNCARCHDHKYDPIAQEDYYRFRAFFEPHDVRMDAVAGQLDRVQDGIPRVCDARPDEPTYLYNRGDERDPDKSKPITPGLPAFCNSTPLEIKAVPLPPIVWYPSIDPQVQQVALNKATSEVTQTQAAFATLQQALAALQQKKATAEKVIVDAKAANGGALPLLLDPAIDVEIKQAEVATKLPEKKSLSALSHLLAVQAKIAADRARTSEPPDPAAAAMALAAGQAEKRMLLARTEEAALATEQQLDAARLAAKPDDAAGKEAIAKAEKTLGDARQAVEVARAEANSPMAQYTPFDKEYPRVSTGRRLALANWIVSKENPLAARVAINHIWLRHFGKPLVPTVFDFGLNGKAPTNPGLLDWLSLELMNHGWSMKHVHRLIVTSSTYRMDSATAGTADPNLAIDPDNHFVWRMNVRRMDAEVVRDSVLYLSGGLDRACGGPDLDQNTADTTARRSLYYRHANEKRVTFLELFDQPNVAEAYQRLDSIVPQQALALLNSRFALDRAKQLAGLLWQSASTGQATGDTGAVPRFVVAAFEQILGRLPTEAEQTECATFLDQQSQLLAKSGELTTLNPANQPAEATPDPAVRARAGLIHVLFNHNDFIAIR